MTIAEFRYPAFISYSHKDSAAAKWLHGSLERFRIDKELIGQPSPLGPVPKRLAPIFRDRDDFAAGHSLTEQTLATLDASAALIVICSPDAAASRYVNEEIRLFRARHRERPVIPMIVAGKPGGETDECFPPALRFQLDAAGAITGQPNEVLAADWRDEADGRALALAKIVARLLGLPTADDIFRRAERDAARRMKRWIAGISTVAVALAGLTVWAEINRREAVGQKEAAEQNLYAASSGFIVAADAITQDLFDVVGTNPTVTVKIIQKIMDEQTRLQGFIGQPMEMKQASGRILSSLADALLAAGNVEEASGAYKQACEIMEAYLIPSNVVSSQDFLTCLIKYFRVLPSDNKISHELSARIAQYANMLVSRFSNDLQLQRTVAVALSNLGNHARQSGTEFDKFFQLSLSAFEKIVSISGAENIVSAKHDFVICVVNYADALISVDRHDEARQYINRSYLMFPSNETENSLAFAETNFLRLRVDHGIACNEFSSETCVESLTKLVAIAWSYLEGGKYVNAIADYADVIRMLGYSFLENCNIEGNTPIAEAYQALTLHYQRLSEMRPLEPDEIDLHRRVRAISVSSRP